MLRSQAMKHFLFGGGDFANSLIGRIAILVLFSLVSGFILTLLFLLPQWQQPVILKFLILAALGLGTGFLARRLLGHRTLALAFFAALLGEIVALSAIAPMTQSFVGIDILDRYPTLPQWDGLLQLAVSGLGSWLALIAWRPKVTITPEKSNHRAPRPTRRPPRPSSSNPLERLLDGARSLQVRAVGGLRRLRSSVAGALSRPLEGLRGGRGKVKVRRPKKRKSPIRRGGGLRRKRGVALSQVVEHRCPYCLELVEPGDPRGVKTCKICHTQHHADCWDVAGVCQVPHEAQ